MNSHPLPPPSTSGNFAERIRFLIQRVGSATEIARMCGFSEGVVRSWRDGNTDPSRARCVTLARTLGISLVWLVAGEGSLQVDPNTLGLDDQYTPRRRRRPEVSAGRVHLSGYTEGHNSVDAQRLATAVKILQTEFSVAGHSVSLSDHADLLSELYEILGPGGSHVDPLAMVTFQHHFAERMRSTGQCGLTCHSSGSTSLTEAATRRVAAFLFRAAQYRRWRQTAPSAGQEVPGDWHGRRDHRH